MPRFRYRIMLTAWLGILAVTIYCQEIQYPDTFTLNNGLKVHLLPCAVDSQWHARLVINGGKKNENECQVGYSQIIEQLLRQWLKEKQSPGLRNGLAATCKIINGQTVLSGSCSQRSFPAQMELFSSAVARLAFTRNQIDIIVDSLIDRYKPENMDVSALAAIFRSRILYGVHHPLGRSYCQYQLEKVLPDQLREFYAAQYMPQRASLWICGNFNSYEVKRIITKHFIKWRLLRKEEQVPDLKPPEIKRGAITFVNKCDADGCFLKWVLPAPSFVSVDQPVFAAACKIFNEFLKRCAKEKNMSENPLLNLKAPVYSGNIMEVNGITHADNLLQTIQWFDTILQNFRKLRVTEQMLGETMQNLKNDYRIKGGSSKGILSLYDPLVYDFETRRNYLNDLSPINLGDIKRLQETYFNPGLYQLIVVGQEHLVSGQLIQLRQVDRYQASDFETCDDACKEVVIVKCHCQSCYERGQCRIWRFDPSQKDAIKSARARAEQSLK